MASVTSISNVNTLFLILLFPAPLLLNVSQMSSGGLFVPSDLSKISVNGPSSAPAFIPFLGRSQASLGFLLTPGFSHPEGSVFWWDASYLQHSMVFVFVLTAITTTENYSHEASVRLADSQEAFGRCLGRITFQTPDPIIPLVAHLPSSLTSSCCMLCSRHPMSFPVHYASPTPGGLGCQPAAMLWKLTGVIKRTD